MKASYCYCQKEHYSKQDDGSYIQEQIIGVCKNLECDSKFVCQMCITIYHSDHQNQIMMFQDLKQMINYQFQDINLEDLENKQQFFNLKNQEFQITKTKLINEINKFAENYEIIMIEAFKQIQALFFIQNVKKEDWAIIQEDDFCIFQKIITNNINNKSCINIDALKSKIQQYEKKFERLSFSIQTILHQIEFQEFLKQNLTIKGLWEFYSQHQLDYLLIPQQYYEIVGSQVNYLVNDLEKYYGQLNQYNERHGKGMQISTKSQVIYEGIWKKNKLLWGQKTLYKIQEGIFYIFRGELNDKLLNGYGQCFLSNGDIYEGYFKDDKFDGKGKMIFSDGQEYDGDWMFGQQNGQGVLKHSNNDLYRGFFKNGKKHGEGIYNNAITQTIYKGHFKNDELDGKITVVRMNGQNFVCDYKSGKANGIGKTTYPDGTVEEGKYINDQKDGVFKLTKGSSLLKIVKFQNGTLLTD